MIQNIERITALSGVEYKKPQSMVKVIPQKQDLMETKEYKNDIKETVFVLLDEAEKDSQITFKSFKKEKIIVNDKKIETENTNGIITIIISEEDIKNTKFSPQEIAYEIKKNKEQYKNLDVSELVGDKKISIDECFVSMNGQNVIFRLYFSK